MSWYDKASEISVVSQDWAAYTPVVGVTSGTAPVFQTVTGVYFQIGNFVFVSIYLTGDGGAEGVGNGLVYITTPTLVSQNGVSTATSLGSGNAYNGAASYNVNVKIWNSTSVRMQNNATSSSMQGGNFNDPTREINISFCYAVDES